MEGGRPTGLMEEASAIPVDVLIKAKRADAKKYSSISPKNEDREAGLIRALDFANLRRIETSTRHVPLPWLAVQNCVRNLRSVAPRRSARAFSADVVPEHAGESGRGGVEDEQR